MRTKKGSLYAFCTLMVVFSGCLSIRERERREHEEHDHPRINFVTFQKKVHPGMTQKELLKAFGPPYVLNLDRAGIERWTYDNVLTNDSPRKRLVVIIQFKDRHTVDSFTTSDYKP